MTRVRTRVREANWARDREEARTNLGEPFARRGQSLVKMQVDMSGRTYTGRMRDSVYSRRMPDPEPDTSTWHVGSSLDYFRYQNDGVGPIFVRRAKALTIKLRRQGRVILRPRTYKPVTPGRFLEKALAVLKSRPF